MRIKHSYITAGIILILVGLWVFSGQIDGLMTTGPEAAQNDTPMVQTERMTVRVAASEAQTFTDALVLRGRTQAFRTVEVKAETSGKIAALPVEKGARVEEGEVLCRLAVQDRQARLDEAKALVKQRQLEYDAGVKLSADGYRSENQVAAAAAALDAAKAQVERMQVEIDNTVIRAPFAGVVDTRPVEVGDYLMDGGICATLLDEDPYLVIGEVSESKVGAVDVGAPAEVTLTDGRTLTGTVRYVAHAASEITRTFRIEIQVPNPDGSLREGLTANIRIPVESTDAHRVSSGLLVLNDEGVLGLRLVNTESRVEFAPVTILGESNDSLWVSGLPETARLIVVGQSFVRQGEAVRVVEAGDMRP